MMPEYRCYLETIQRIGNGLDKNKKMRGMGFEPKNSYETRPST